MTETIDRRRTLKGPAAMALYGGKLWRAYYGWNGNLYLGRTSYKRRLLLHRVLWEDKHGPIPDGFVVHHIDGNRWNNEPENLELLSSAQHSRHHNAEKNGGIPESMRLWNVTCLACGSAVSKLSNIPVKYCDHRCKKRYYRWLKRRT